MQTVTEMEVERYIVETWIAIYDVPLFLLSDTLHN